ncbi:hypothetical protein B0H34DRAFT_796913 [Crassisporium funariophilum]|nr:hypothetical protein B0H34DRAFT_796913 [Crassisporium funariophilum]
MGFITTWFRREATSLDGLHEDDQIIILMGPTGGGKSTFINTAAATTLLKVGHNLQSCTTDIAYVAHNDPVENVKRQVVFVDTPPFPDPDPLSPKTAKHVEVMIQEWLKKAYAKRKIKVAGILYLYNITGNRDTQPPRRNRLLIENLCGDASRALLVTTMWESVNPEIGRLRHEELEAKWTRGVEGTPVACHNGTQESAWKIVEQLLA